MAGSIIISPRNLAGSPFFILTDIMGIATFVSLKTKFFQNAFKTKKQWPLLVTAFLCIAFTSLSAQKKKLKDSTPEQRAKMQTEWMKTKLALNTTQVQQVAALNLQYAQKNDPVIQSNEGKISKFKKLKALQKRKI